MNAKQSTALAYVLGIIIVAGLSYGMWQLGRHINYSLSYEDMVQETVCEMVKPEHLKNPKGCK